MLNEHVLDALLAINVPADQARAAAISLTEYEPKLQGLDLKITALEGKVEAKFAALEGKVAQVQWMLGVVLALLIAIVVKLFHF